MKSRFSFTARARCSRGELKLIQNSGPVIDHISFSIERVRAQRKADGTDPGSRWKKRILLIDDDEQVLTSVAVALESERYDVILAANGAEAVLQCQRYRPDLIVVDLNMPLQNGWETLEDIEALSPFLPMIVITGTPMQYDHAIAFGVDALMEKPLDFPVLLAAIDKLLAEPEHERLARITRENFTTLKLDSTGAKKR